VQKARNFDPSKQLCCATQEKVHGFCHPPPPSSRPPPKRRDHHHPTTDRPRLSFLRILTFAPTPFPLVAVLGTTTLVCLPAEVTS